MAFPVDQMWLHSLPTTTMTMIMITNTNAWINWGCNNSSLLVAKVSHDGILWQIHFDCSDHYCYDEECWMAMIRRHVWSHLSCLHLRSVMTAFMTSSHHPDGRYLKAALRPLSVTGLGGSKALRIRKYSRFKIRSVRSSSARCPCLVVSLLQPTGVGVRVSMFPNLVDGMRRSDDSNKIQMTPCWISSSENHSWRWGYQI